jgi:hypothetical protein
VVSTATIPGGLVLYPKSPKERPAMTKLTKTATIPLNRAVLCLDCSCVSNANRECPACSSKALMNLGAVLDRRAEFSYAEDLAVA